MVSLVSGLISGEAAPRLLTSWIDSFVELTAGSQSPEIFRRWAAVSTIAGALERKVWMKLKGWDRVTYPNLYVLLIGGPGIGKGDALRYPRELWRSLPNIHIAPGSVSRASLMDAIADANRSFLDPSTGTFEKFNSLQVCSEEFGMFLVKYEGEFMSTLNHLWDCVLIDEKKRAMKEPIIVPKPSLNLIAGTTPTWLGTSLPQQAWSEGFSSRLLMVYSAERVKKNPFEATLIDESLMEKLTFDLLAIHDLFGQFSFSKEFAALFVDWYQEDCPPVPDHPKLEHYLPRRPAHFLKLTMVMAASRASDLVVTREDFYEAYNLLIDTEAQMPEIFKAIKYNSDANVTDEVYSFIWQAYAKEGKGISANRIYRFLAERAPSYAIEHIFQSMLKSRMLVPESVGGGDGGANTYRPAPKTAF